MADLWSDAYTTHWCGYERKEDLKMLMKTGDLIQIRKKNQPKRKFPHNMIEHWGVASKRHPVTDVEFADGFLLIHLNNPSSSSSSASPSQLFYTENIRIDPIDSEWDRDKEFRIHNFRDQYWKPATEWEKIKARILTEINSKKKYNLFQYNCEMFAHQIRHGHYYSGQVAKANKDLKWWTFGLLDFYKYD